MPQFETIAFMNTIIDAKQILDKQKDVRTIAFVGATKPFVTQSQAHESGYQLVLELNNGIRMLVLYQPDTFTVTVKGVEFVPNERSPEGFRLPVINKCIPAESFMNRFAKLGAVLPEQPTASPTDEPKAEQPDWESAFYDQIVALGYNAILKRGAPSEIEIRGVGYDFMELLLLTSDQIVSRHRGTRYTQDQVFAGLIALRDRREQRKVAVEQALLNKPDWFVDLMNQITDLGLNVMPFKSEGGAVNSLSISNDSLALVAHCTDIDCITIEGMRGVISRKQLLYFLTTQADGAPTDEPGDAPKTRVVQLVETLQARGYDAFDSGDDILCVTLSWFNGCTNVACWRDSGGDLLQYCGDKSTKSPVFHSLQCDVTPDALLEKFPRANLYYIKTRIKNSLRGLSGLRPYVLEENSQRDRLRFECLGMYIVYHDKGDPLRLHPIMQSEPENDQQAAFQRDFNQIMTAGAFVELATAYIRGALPEDQPVAEPTAQPSDTVTNEPRSIVEQSKKDWIAQLRDHYQAQGCSTSLWASSDSTTGMIVDKDGMILCELTLHSPTQIYNDLTRQTVTLDDIIGTPSMSPDEIVKAFRRRGVHASFEHGVLAITGAYEGKPYASDCYIRATVIGGTKWKPLDSTELGLTDKELFDRYPCTLEYFAHRLRYDVREAKPPRLLQISYDIDNQELLIGDEAVDMVARFKFQRNDHYGYTEIQPVSTTPVKNDDQKLFYSVFANKGNAFWYNSLLASICAYLEKIVHLVDEPAAQPTATPMAIDQLVAVLRKRGIMASYDGDLSIVRAYDLQPDCTYKPMVDVWMCATVSNGTTLWLNDEHGGLSDSELLARYQVTPDYFLHRIWCEMKLKQLPAGLFVYGFKEDDGSGWAIIVLDENQDMLTKYRFYTDDGGVRFIPTYSHNRYTSYQERFWNTFHKTHTYDSLLASICAYLTYA